jgi:hypothetical protein
MEMKRIGLSKYEKAVKLYRRGRSYAEIVAQLELSDEEAEQLEDLPY